MADVLFPLDVCVDADADADADEDDDDADDEDVDEDDADELCGACLDGSPNSKASKIICSVLELEAELPCALCEAVVGGGADTDPEVDWELPEVLGNKLWNCGKYVLSCSSKVKGVCPLELDVVDAEDVLATELDVSAGVVAPDVAPAFGPALAASSIMAVYWSTRAW